MKLHHRIRSKARIIRLILLIFLCFPFTLTAQETIVLINPVDRPIVQRCFIAYEGKKRTNCAAVGEVSGVHYAIDLSSGSILNTWRGAFLDATTMWTERGELQLAIPLGKLNVHSGKQAFALLKTKESLWPDSIQHSYEYKGYSLDQDGRPNFKYVFDGISIEDSIVPETKHQGLKRILSFPQTNIPSYLFFLFAEAKKIEKVKKNLYAINGLEYYIEINGDVKEVFLEKTNDNYRLITPVHKNRQINYSIIW